MQTLEQKLTHLIREARALQQTHKRELEQCEAADWDLDAGLVSLEDALKALVSRDEEEDGDTLSQHQRTESRQSRYV